MDTDEARRTAIAILTAIVHEDEALDGLIRDATLTPEDASATIGGMAWLFLLELQWHARERSTTVAALLSDLGEMLASLPYEGEQPPDDWEGWGPMK